MKINSEMMIYLHCQYVNSITYLGISFSRFHPENLVMPGVEIKPLYRDWLGLARGKPMPAELPRRAAAVPGVLRFRILN